MCTIETQIEGMGDIVLLQKDLDALLAQIMTFVYQVGMHCKRPDGSYDTMILQSER